MDINRDLFMVMNKHLMEDEQPSLYFNEISFIWLLLMNSVSGNRVL
jgi:hypothetical protein